MASIFSDQEGRVKHNGIAATLCVGFCFVATLVSPQGSTNRLHIGLVQDWSHRHIVFSREGLLQHPDLLYREPRVLSQAIQRWQRRDPSAVTSIDAAASPAISNKRDWNVPNLPGRVASNMFPAKFSFDPGLPPDCAKDFVVFGLTNTGVSGGAANLIAFNNLYVDSTGTGSCSGTSPNVMFAYNITTTTGSGIHTSPVLSYPDGKKIAFIESSPTSSVFHVLTWTAGQGSPFGAAIPNMTSLPLAGTDNNTTSSPWIDYFGDIAYVGTDDGRLHKITGVFKGTPTEVTTAPWPITVNGANRRLSSPVLDGNLIMVGVDTGKLFRIDATTGVLTPGLNIGKSNANNPGLFAAPILDVTSGTAFVVSADDGKSGVLVQVQINGASLTTLATANIGVASANSANTKVNLYEPALSDSYFTSPSSGQIRLCGTGSGQDISPWLYTFGFDSTGKLITSPPNGKIQLTTSTLARCTAVTEFFNQLRNGGTDFFFLGITTECGGAGTSGCVVARSTGAQPASMDIPGGPTGIVVDNYSKAAQASSIYFMSDGINTAYKLAQDGLSGLN